MKKNLLTALMITAIGVATLTGCGQAEEGKASEAVTQTIEETAETKEETVKETVTAEENESEETENVENKPEEKDAILNGADLIVPEDSGYTYGDNYDENYDCVSYEDRKQEAYEEKKSEVLSGVDRCKINKDIHGALKILYDAREEYPEDEFFFELQHKLMTCQPDYIEENFNIIRKKGCKVGLDSIELYNGERVTEDFSINFGGGNIVLDLSDQYKVVDLKVFLSNMAPTKGLMDIDFVCDGVVMDRIKGFDVNCGLIEKSIDVTGVNVFEISMIDCTHDWVGEASFFKPDAECHFTFRAYTEKSIEWR